MPMLLERRPIPVNVGFRFEATWRWRTPCGALVAEHDIAVDVDAYFDAGELAYGAVYVRAIEPDRWVPAPVHMASAICEWLNQPEMQARLWSRAMEER